MIRRGYLSYEIIPLNYGEAGWFCGLFRGSVSLSG